MDATLAVPGVDCYMAPHLNRAVGFISNGLGYDRKISSVVGLVKHRSRIGRVRPASATRLAMLATIEHLTHSRTLSLMIEPFVFLL